MDFDIITALVSVSNVIDLRIDITEFWWYLSERVARLIYYIQIIDFGKDVLIKSHTYFPVISSDCVPIFCNRNIEDIMTEKGETVKRLLDRDCVEFLVEDDVNSVVKDGPNSDEEDAANIS